MSGMRMTHSIDERLPAYAQQVFSQMGDDRSCLTFNPKMESNRSTRCEPLHRLSQFGGQISIFGFERTDIPDRLASLAEALFPLLPQVLQPFFRRLRRRDYDFGKAADLQAKSRDIL